MEQNVNKPSIKISGSGSSGGGDFDQIKISGSGKISGDTKCNLFKISGSAHIEGNIEMEEGTVSGSAKFSNELKANELKISGSASCLGEVNAKRLKISGSFSGDASLSGEEVVVTGGLKIKGDCNAELFEMRGQCRIGGLLNADRVEICLDGKSEVKAIGAETIEIKCAHHGSILKDVLGLFTDHHQRIYCESIEGDDIYLENTTCDVVRGGKIVIGKGCQIKTIEYTGSLEVHSEAKIETQAKI